VVGTVREPVKNESLVGDFPKIAAFGEEDVCVELGAAVKEGRDGLKTVLDRGGVVGEIGDELGTQPTSKAGLHT
jgi:hypothetical protein